MRNTNYSNWVWSQNYLMISLLVLAPLTSTRCQNNFTYIIGFILLGISALVGIAGVIALGKNRRSTPEPHPESQLVTTGIYSLIRHPLYLSLILFYVGWAILWTSIGGAIGAIVFSIFIDRKARLEEILLQEKFPSYTDYAKKSARFIPGIY